MPAERGAMILGLLLSLALVADAPPAVLILPVLDEGGRVVSEPPIDIVTAAVLKAGVTSTSTHDKVANTVRQLESRGRRCAGAKVNCFANIGVVLDATHVLASVVRSSDNLSLILVDVSASAVLRETVVDISASPERTERMERAVLFVLTGAAPVTPPARVTPPTGRTGVAEPVASLVVDTHGDAAEPGMSALAVTGAAVTGVGLVGAAILGGIAGALQLQYANPATSLDDRNQAFELGPPLQIAALTAGGVAVVGAVVLGAGLALD